MKFLQAHFQVFIRKFLREFHRGMFHIFFLKIPCETSQIIYPQHFCNDFFSIFFISQVLALIGLEIFSTLLKEISPHFKEFLQRFLQDIFQKSPGIPLSIL